MGLFYMMEIYQPARRNKWDLAVLTAMWGGGKEKKKRKEKRKGSQLGKDNNSEPAKTILRVFSRP